MVTKYVISGVISQILSIKDQAGVLIGLQRFRNLPLTYFLTVVAHGRVKVGGQTEDHTLSIVSYHQRDDAWERPSI